MKKIALINCKPKIIAKKEAEITLRFPGGEEERKAFEEAVRQAKLSPEGFTAEYAKKHGILDTTLVEVE